MGVEYYITTNDGTPPIVVGFSAPTATYEGADEDVQAVFAAVASVMRGSFTDLAEAAEAYGAYAEHERAKKAALKSAAASGEAELFPDLPDEPALAHKWLVFLATAEDAAQGVYDNTALSGGNPAPVGMSIKFNIGADAVRTPVHKFNYALPDAPAL